MHLVTPELEVNALRARIAALEGLLAEHERAAAEHLGRMERLVTELSVKARTFESTLRSIGDGVIVCDREGRFVHFNRAAESIFGLGATDVPVAAWSSTYGCFLPDGVTPYPSEELPLARAVRGEPVDRTEILIRHPGRPTGIFVEALARSILNDDGERIGAVVIFRDISERKHHEREMEQKLLAEREKNDALARLRLTVQELSTPILEVWDEILALPLIGVVDSKRAGEVMDRLLYAVIEHQCRFVILDVTGVDVLDTMTADHLLRMVRAVELLGARCALTGIRPSVAHTLVDFGVAFGSLVTLRNLKHGLRTCMRWKDEAILTSRP